MSTRSTPLGMVVFRALRRADYNAYPKISKKSPRDMVILGYDHCPYCKKAIRLLDKLGVPYVYFTLAPDRDTKLIHKLMEITSQKTVPMIFGPGGRFIGGLQDLVTEYANIMSDTI